MKYMYTRVSTDKQETGNQSSALQQRFPDAILFEEVASGAKDRPVLSALIHLMKEGDTLIVAALDRLGRRTMEILALIEDLTSRGIILVSVREGVDYSTIAGRLVTQILVSVAEMERGLISERTKTALATKRALGIKMGRKPTYSQEVYNKIKELRAAGLTLRAIASATGVSIPQCGVICRSEQQIALMSV